MSSVASKLTNGTIILQLLSGVVLAGTAGYSLLVKAEVHLGPLVGIGYFAYIIGWFAWWTYLLVQAYRKNFTEKIWVQATVLAACFSLANFVMIFVSFGIGHKIWIASDLHEYMEEFRQASYLLMAAFIFATITPLMFLYMMLRHKKAIIQTPPDYYTPHSAPTHHQSSAVSFTSSVLKGLIFIQLFIGAWILISSIFHTRTFVPTGLSDEPQRLGEIVAVGYISFASIWTTFWLSLLLIKSCKQELSANFFLRTKALSLFLAFFTLSLSFVMIGGALQFCTLSMSFLSDLVAWKWGLGLLGGLITGALLCFACAYLVSLHEAALLEEIQPAASDYTAPPSYFDEGKGAHTKLVDGW